MLTEKFKLEENAQTKLEENAQTEETGWFSESRVAENRVSKNCISENRASERGATTLEFVVSALVFIPVLIAVVDTARLCYQAQLLQYVTNELSRRVILKDIPEYPNVPRNRAINLFARQKAKEVGFELSNRTTLVVYREIKDPAVSPALPQSSSCRILTNPPCNGLDLGEPSKHIYISLEQPISIFVSLLTFNVKAGALVRNEPFQA